MLAKILKAIKAIKGKEIFAGIMFYSGLAGLWYQTSFLIMLSVFSIIYGIILHNKEL